MTPRLVITFLVCLVASSTLASNNWADFDANDIYTKYDLSNCQFPFTYQGNTYNNCTTDGDNGNRPWCSLTPTYLGLFTYCYDFWNSNLQCAFPFTLNGKNFTDCAVLSRTSVYPQCRSNNSNYPFRYCIESVVKKSGQPLLHTSNCNSSYYSLSVNHSKCAGPSDFAIPIPLNATDQQAILDTHNQYRAAVGAKSMFKLYWDPVLADMAQTHASMCAFDHDLANNRMTLNFNWLNGQNMVMATEIRSSPTDLLTIMYDSEKPRLNYGVGCNPDGTCTHYTQLMLSNMTRMGCAQTHCIYPDRIERYLVCNYIHAQYSNNYMTPYVVGPSPGSDCPLTKDANGLCDCGNKICKYDSGETLNPNTCVCDSPSSKRDVSAGSSSEQVDVENIKNSMVVLPFFTPTESQEKREIRKYAHKKSDQDKRALRVVG